VFSVAAFDDTDSGEGEVIFNGVGGVDFKKTFGNFEAGGERRGFLMIEAEDSAEPRRTIPACIWLRLGGDEIRTASPKAIPSPGWLAPYSFCLSMLGRR